MTPEALKPTSCETFIRPHLPETGYYTRLNQPVTWQMRVYRMETLNPRGREKLKKRLGLPSIGIEAASTLFAALSYCLGNSQKLTCKKEEILEEILQNLSLRFPECKDFFTNHPGSLLPPLLFLEHYKKTLSDPQKRVSFEEHFKNSKLPPVKYAYLLLVTMGLKNTEIGRILGTSSQTVKNIITEIYRKLSQTTGKTLARTDIISQAESLRLIPPFLFESRVIIDPQKHGLTRREKEILELLEKGLFNKEIAFKLKIKPSTVRNHIRNIACKLGLRSWELRRRIIKSSA